jgi:AraC family transcriptional regulator, ethanolamine operon transcriptional activator
MTEIQRAESADIQDQAAMLSTWEQSYIQMERGRFSASVLQARVGASLTVFRKTTDRRLHKVFASPADLFSLALVMPGSDRATYLSQPVLPGDVLVIPPARELSLVCHGALDVAVLALERSRIPAAWTGDEAHLFDIAGTISGRDAAPFSRRLEAIMRLLERGEDPADLVQDADCSAVSLVLGWHGRGSGDRADNPDIVRRAHRFIARHLECWDDLPAMPEMARSVGVSVRVLEYAFADRLGVSPRKYGEFVRLAYARRDIRARNGSVTEVAMRRGFNHLGRFAQSYRALFGELPSTSLPRKTIRPSQSG